MTFPRRHIVTIDPASKLGWAQRIPRVRIRSGSFQLKGTEDERCQAYENWLGQFDFTNTIVAYETPHQMPGRASSFRVGCHLQATLWRVLRSFEGVVLLGVAAPAVKWEATGKGNCKKELVIKAMEKRWGKKVADDNEADALALLCYALRWEEENRTFRVRSIFQV